jgi:hypothetical protein
VRLWKSIRLPRTLAAMADWVTISALATAGGTLGLAGATFASVRSSSRTARAAERSLLAGLRPLLMPSRPDDIEQKVGFADEKRLHVPGGQGAAEATDEAVYLAISLRNAGTGIAVLHGWALDAGRNLRAPDHAPLEAFTRLTRDMYIPAHDVGFWQGTFRDPDAADFKEVREAIDVRSPLSVEVLYGDHEGGQRTISRYVMAARGDGDGWLVSVARHWNIDRGDPR